MKKVKKDIKETRDYLLFKKGEMENQESLAQEDPMVFQGIQVSSNCIFKSKERQKPAPVANSFLLKVNDFTFLAKIVLKEICTLRNGAVIAKMPSSHGDHPASILSKTVTWSYGAQG